MVEMNDLRIGEVSRRPGSVSPSIRAAALTPGRLRRSSRDGGFPEEEAPRGGCRGSVVRQGGLAAEEVDKLR